MRLLTLGFLALATAKRRSTLESKASTIAKKLFPDSFRSTNVLMFAIKDVDGYGCWCRLNEQSHGSGRGMPVDVYDKFCRNYHKGVECLAHDFGQSCNPWDVDYNMKIRSTSKSIDCDGNTDPCSRALCQVETKFLMDFLAERVAFESQPLQHRIYNPKSPAYVQGWTDEQCWSGLGQDIDFETQCCGTYPILEFELKYQFYF